jgi:transcriptional regulator with XRE-family HTH domain
VVNLLGARIRKTREDRGLSLRALASAWGFSASFLSQVERGISSPSIVSLMALCEILKVRIGELLPEQGVSDSESAQAELLSSPHQQSELIPVPSPILRKGECPIIRIPSSEVKYNWLSGPSRGNPIEVVIGELPPCFDHPIQSHVGGEFGFILEGETAAIIDGVTYDLCPGDSYSINGEQPHGFKTGKKGVKILWYHTRRFMEWYASTRD